MGASVAGPTAAYWFAKAGADVTIIERFPQLRTNGQNIDIRTAGVTVMRKIPGMEAAVRAKRTPMEGLSFVYDNGRPFATMKATGDPNQQSRKRFLRQHHCHSVSSRISIASSGAQASKRSDLQRHNQLSNSAFDTFDTLLIRRSVLPERRNICLRAKALS